MEESSDGVFGNLPASRPGARSPRRDGAREAQEKPAKKPTPKRAAAKPPPPPPPPPPPQRTSESSRSAGSEGRPTRGETAEKEGGGGVEDLAWAGVTVAAKAATAGVKLMSRALESARKQVERPPKP